MLLIGMMVTGLAPWPLGRLIELDEVRLMLFAPSGIKWEKRMILGLHLESGRWVRRTVPFPAAVYNRCYSDQRRVIQRLEKVIGQGRIFNYVTCFDKWEINEVLRRGGLGRYLPETYLFEKRRLTEMFDSSRGIVVKPRRGRGGKGLHVLRRNDAGEVEVFCGLGTNQACDLAEAKQEWAASHIMQEEIPMLQWDDSVFDIRLLMQKDETGTWRASADHSRVAVPGVLVTNICKKICYAEEVLVQVGLEPREVLEKLESVSLEVAELLDRHFVMLGEISVDFALDTEGEVWIIEVNGKPDRNLFFALRDEALIQTVLMRPLEYACYLAT